MRTFFVYFPTITKKELKSFFRVSNYDITCFDDMSVVSVNIEQGESVLEKIKHFAFHYPDMPFDVLAEPNEAGWGKEEEYIECYHRNGEIIIITQSDKVIPIIKLRTMSYAEITKAIEKFDKKMDSIEPLADIVKNYKEVKCVGC